MKKKNLLFIHGLTSNKNSNATLKEYCLKNKIKYYSLDLPGHGNKSFGNIELTISGYSNFVLDYIEKKNIKKPILVGHSFGGSIIVNMLSKMKEEEKNLVILEDPFNGSIKDFNISYRIRHKKINFDPIYYLKKISQLKKYSLSDIKKMNELFVNLINEDNLNILNKKYEMIDIPTLVIFGEEDRVLDARLSKKEILRLNQNITLVIIKKAAHSPHIDTPTNYLTTINEFLKKNN